MTACELCGHDPAVDPPLVRGDWRLFPRIALLRGEAVGLTVQEAGFLYALADEAPNALAYERIAARISDRNRDIYGLVKVIASKIRAKLDAAPFENVWGFGYRWAT